MRIDFLLLRFGNSPLFRKRIFWHLFFTTCFVAVCLRFHYDEFLFERPHGIHVWRQTDCTSITLNYFQNNEPFFEPAMHFRLNENGNAVGEFPLFFYIVSILYRIFGFDESVYRIFWLLITFIGSFCFYRLSSDMLENNWLGIALGLLPFLSPLLGFYSISFISDPISVYLGFMFLFAIFKAHEKSNFKLFYLAVFLALLSALTKVTGIVIPMIIMGIGVLFYALVEFNKMKLIHLTAGILITVIGTLSWLKYAMYFNELNTTNYFFLRAAPIWELNMEEIEDIWFFIRTHFLKDIYPKFMFYALPFFFLLFLIKWKSEKIIISFLLLYGASQLAYFVFFFPQFKYHDYYFIHMVPLFSLSALGFFYLLKDRIRGIMLRFLLFPIVVFFVVQNINYGVLKIKEKRELPKVYGSLSHQGYYDLAGELEVRGYYDLEEKLRSIGINRRDKVISIPDPSPNTTLYLMNQPGWSNLYHLPFTKRMVELKLAEGAKYLIVGHESVLMQEDLQEFMTKPIGKHKEITIFEL